MILVDELFVKMYVERTLDEESFQVEESFCKFYLKIIIRRIRD